MTWRRPRWSDALLIVVGGVVVAQCLAFAYDAEAWQDRTFLALGWIGMAGQAYFFIAAWRLRREIKEDQKKDDDTLRVMKGVQAMIEAACDRTRANIDYIRACESAQEAGQPLPDPPPQIADAGFPVPPRGRLH